MDKPAAPETSRPAGFIRRMHVLTWVLLIFVSMHFIFLLPTNLSADVESTSKQSKSNEQLNSNFRSPGFLQMEDQQQQQQQQQCLGLDENQEMESLIANAKQIFVTMPAKAGGTSMKAFTKQCMKRLGTDNILSLPNRWSKYFVESLHVQSIISSHLYKEDNFIRLVNSPSRETLMIHTHREEGSRVVSAVKQISQHICNSRGKFVNQQESSMSETTIHIASSMRIHLWKR